MANLEFKNQPRNKISKSSERFFDFVEKKLQNVKIHREFEVGGKRFDGLLQQNGKNICLIEFDGWRFHSTSKDIRRDNQKNTLGAKENYKVVRIKLKSPYDINKNYVLDIIQKLGKNCDIYLENEIENLFSGKRVGYEDINHMISTLTNKLKNRLLLNQKESEQVYKMLVTQVNKYNKWFNESFLPKAFRDLIEKVNS